MIDAMSTLAQGLSHQSQKLKQHLARYCPFLPKLVVRSGYDHEQWIRVVQMQQWQAFIASLPSEKLSVLEISPGPHPWFSKDQVGHYKSVDFPDFDITRDCLSERFDLIIAEQVFEHLRHPYRAAANVLKMLKDEGIFMIATPFLVRIHGHPFDYTRWSEDGLRGFLEDCGFSADVYSWGNRKAVRANLARWREYGWHRDVKNEPEFPIVVWAYARKPQEKS